MKALVLKKYMELSYEDAPDPEPGAKDVLIKVKACSICGSDVHGLDGSTGRRIPPLIMGHEASGVIEKVGSSVKGWKKGEPRDLRLDRLLRRMLVLQERRDQSLR